MYIYNYINLTMSYFQRFMNYCGVALKYKTEQDIYSLEQFHENKIMELNKSIDTFKLQLQHATVIQELQLQHATVIQELQDDFKLQQHYLNKDFQKLQQQTIVKQQLQDDFIKGLQEQISSSEPYETIHEFSYPTWSSIEEFTESGNYKYFQAVQDFPSFHKIHDKHTTTRKEWLNYYMIVYMGKKCTFIDWEGEDKNIWREEKDGRLSSVKSVICEKSNVHSNSMIHSLYDSDKFFNTLKLNLPTTSLKRSFGKSCSDITGNMKYNEKILTLNYMVYYYIQIYITGWVLLNPESVMYRSPKVEINVIGNNIHICIKRLKIPNLIDGHSNNSDNHVCTKGTKTNDIHMEKGFSCRLIVNNIEICNNVSDITKAKNTQGWIYGL
jgi:hypothetical protein